MRLIRDQQRRAGRTLLHGGAVRRQVGDCAANVAVQRVNVPLAICLDLKFDARHANAAPFAPVANALGEIIATAYL